MKVLLCFVLIFLEVARADIAGECDMAFFYQEQGCTPVASDNSTSCPLAFTCPELQRDPTKCYYKGVPYAANAMIPQNLIKHPCSQQCICAQVYGSPQFECAPIDCYYHPEDLETCIKVYELNSCCSVGSVCGKVEIANLKTCEVDGMIYREGETFTPKNTVKICMCTAQWNGSVDPAYCREKDCGFGLHYQNDFPNNCAPRFSKNSTGRCPFAFKCASSETKVVRGLNTRAVSYKCLFGNDTLAVGDEVIVKDKCKCSCKVPPFVSCTECI